MTTPSTYLAEPTASDEGLFALFRPVFDKIAQGNLERERERVFPHEQVRWLAEVDFGTVRIPAIHGGVGASPGKNFPPPARVAPGGPHGPPPLRHEPAGVLKRRT